MTKIRVLRSEIWLPAPIDSVFHFFSRPENLNRITPPWLHFRILSAHDTAIHEATRINYRLKIRGASINWQSEIRLWDPPRRFVDAQIKGPFKCWVHQHEFEERDDGTIVRDNVEYALHGWIFEFLLDHFLVKGDLARIFRYRRAKLNEIFSL
jgi:ligand-binding SRPBCC domain-containing protein